MNYSKRWKEYLRSTQGQVSLFAATFAGAIVLAVVSVAVRSVFFERFVREDYPIADDRLINLVTETTRIGAPPNAGNHFTEEELDQIYGAWISDSIADPDGRVADYLFAVYGRQLLDRIRVTFVAGSNVQKLRAVELIEHAAAGKYRGEALELCQFFRRRAIRRHEPRLENQIDSVIRKLTAANKSVTSD